MKVPGLLKTTEARSSIPSFEQYNDLNAYGLYSSVDIYNCDPEIMRDADMIKLYLMQLCDLLEMHHSDDTNTIKFNSEKKKEGYSILKQIDTSIITGHFANLKNTAYIDIFSCRYFDPEVVAHFTVSYFKGSDYFLNITIRK